MPRTHSIAAHCLITAAALAGCAAQQKQAPEAAAAAPAAAATAFEQTSEPIPLRFDWPEGLRAQVVSTSVKAQSSGAQSRTQDLTTTYIMRANRTPDTVSVAFENFEVDHPGSGVSSAGTAKLLAYRPGFAVDASGELKEITGIEILKQPLEAAKQEAENAPEAEQQAFEVVAQSVTSEAYLKNRAGTEWSNLIGSWRNRTLTPGRVETTEQPSAASGILETPITAEVSTSLSQLDTCQRTGAKACVRLRVIQQPDVEQMREAIRPTLGKLLGVEDWGPEGPPQVRSVIATSQLIVDTEPDTLIPHRVESLRVFSLELVRSNGPFEVRDSNRTTTTYSYD